MSRRFVRSRQLPRPAAPPGFAIPAVIFGMVVMSVLVTGIWTSAAVDRQAAANRADAARALRLAHTASAHALSLFRDELKDSSFTTLFRGPDGAANTADDGLLTGYAGLGDSLNIPAIGRTAYGGRYHVQVVDDPADSDGDVFLDANYRAVVRCTGITDRGARATLEFVLFYQPPLPGVVFNAPLTISGDLTVSGPCGDLHVNGTVTNSGKMIVNAKATASGTATNSGTVKNASRQPIAFQGGKPPLALPTLNPADYCPTADYVLQDDGLVLSTSDSTLQGATGSSWMFTSGAPNVTWTTDSEPPAGGGSFCVEGNVRITESWGSESDPLPLSIFATGSIDITADPNLQPAHPSGITLLAAGDLRIRGNPSSSDARNFDGLFYGGAQCEITGDPNLMGQFICMGGVQPAGSIDWVTANRITGDARITYGCANETKRTKRRIVSWYQRIGV